MSQAKVATEAMLKALLPNAPIDRGLYSNKDLNDLTQPGVYKTFGCANYPSALSQYGVIEVFGVQDYLIQRFNSYTQAAFAMRRKSSSTESGWTEWQVYKPT